MISPIINRLLKSKQGDYIADQMLATIYGFAPPIELNSPEEKRRIRLEAAYKYYQKNKHRLKAKKMKECAAHEKYFRDTNDLFWSSVRGDLARRRREQAERRAQIDRIFEVKEHVKKLNQKKEEICK